MIAGGTGTPVQTATTRRKISLRERYITGAVVLTVLVFTTMGRNAVTVLVEGRRVRTLGEASTSSQAGRSATLAVLVVLALLVAYVVLRFWREPKRPVGILLLTVAPLLLLLVRDYATVGSMANATIASVGLLFALWMIAPPLQVFRVLGLLSVTVAVVSIALGLAAPNFALVTQSTGNDKALLGDHLLAGAFTHPNLLGLFLALSAPFVLLLRRWFWGLSVVALALIWSASRTALLAAAVAFGLGVLFLVVSRRWQRILGGLATLVAFGLVVYIPFSTTDPAVLTRRGEIWIYSLAHLGDQSLWGLSPSWYDKIVPASVGIFNAAAFHGHNDVVTMLVRIGIVGLAMVIAVYWMAWRSATRRESIPTLPVVIFFIAAMTAAISETIWRPESDNVLFLVSIVPVCLAVFGTDDAAERDVRARGRRARER